jgi:hypothetical protein
MFEIFRRLRPMMRSIVMDFTPSPTLRCKDDTGNAAATLAGLHPIEKLNIIHKFQ